MQKITAMSNSAWDEAKLIFGPKKNLESLNDKTSQTYWIAVLLIKYVSMKCIIIEGLVTLLNTGDKAGRNRGKE